MTKYFLEHTKIVFLILLIIIIGGIAAYFNLPREEDSDFVVKTAVVTTYFPGADSQKVELLVTSKLEKIIQEIPEIDYIQSISKSGVSIIYVNILDEYTSPRPIWDELRRKVEKTIPDLPEDIQKPSVNDEFADVFGSIVTITGEGFSYKEIKDIADYVKDELLLIQNIAKIDLLGTQKEVVFLEYDIGRLSQFGITPPQLKQILENTNILTSGGSVKILDERILIEPSGNFENISDIQKTVIQLKDKKEIIYLGDIVNVKRGYLDPADMIVHSNGKRAIALAMSMKKGTDMPTLGYEVKKKLKNMQMNLPLGIDFDLSAFQPDFVKKITDKFILSLFQSICIVIGFIFIVLGFRFGGIAASLIPMTILLVFLEMFVLKISLNKLTIAALIVSLGIIVNNAIIISESVLVKISQGISKKNAVLLSAKELYLPLIVFAFAGAISFLPVFLAKSTAAEYCKPMFKVITMALFSSEFLVLSLIPVFCSLFFIEQTTKSPPIQIIDSKFYSEYQNRLLLGMKNPESIFFKIIILFLSAMLLFYLFVPKIFFPPSDRPVYQLEIEAPQGTSIEKTEETVHEIENFLVKDLKSSSNPNGIINWSAYIGKGVPRYVRSLTPEPLNPSYAAFIINTTSFDKLPKFISKIRSFCEDNFPDVNLSIKKVPTGPIFNSPVEIRISGENTDKIFDYAQRVKEKLSTINGISEISDDWGIKNRIIIVKINTSKAYRAGVTNKDIAISLQSAFSGFDISKYREEDNIIPIIYRTTEVYRDYLGKISTLTVYSQDAKISVPLKQVADVSLKWEYPQIVRRDRIKTVTIKAQTAENQTSYDINRQLIPWLKKESDNWEYGYNWRIGGSEEKFVASVKSLKQNIPVAFLGIIFLMMIYFNSFKIVFIILLTSFLPFTGGFLGLFFTGSDFNFMTLAGIILLFVVVLNNIILLVDKINKEIKDSSEDISMAIVTAAKMSFRPVSLVILISVSGLFPLLWTGDSLFFSMTVFMIFGLLSSVFFILFVLPIFYGVIWDINKNKFEIRN